MNMDKPTFEYLPSKSFLYHLCFRIFDVGNEAKVKIRIMTYLLKVYKTKNSKTHFITDVVNTELTGYNEVEELLIGKKYYEDSSRTKLLGICRKSEVVNVF